MKKIKIYLGITALAVTFAACKKESSSPTTPPAPSNEEELITSVRLIFADTAGIQPNVVAMFRDVDGPGGNNPSVFDTIRLKANTVYTATVEFLNESVNPTIDITAEIMEEAVDHLICYSVFGANVSIVKTDSDGMYEVGVATRWTTLGASEGTTLVTLKHQPGIKNGNCDLGDTDVEISFVTIIE